MEVCLPPREGSTPLEKFQSTPAALGVWLVLGEGFLRPWFESTPADLEVCLCLKEGSAPLEKFQSTPAVLGVWLVSREGFLHPWFESTPADLEVCLCLKEGFYTPGGGLVYPCCHGGLSTPQ